MELLKSIKNSSFIIKRFVANSILALRDAGTKAKLTFSLLIMTIVGGAVDPVIMGYIADTTGSMAIAFLIPLVCYGDVDSSSDILTALQWDLKWLDCGSSLGW